ncbi:MAG: heme exporter protein CcmD [Pseudomonadota bacterium]
MSFSSFGEFLAMGEHGLYVWLSYGAALIIVVYNVVSVRLRLRRFFDEARAQQRRRQGAEAPGPSPGESTRT